MKSADQLVSEVVADQSLTDLGGDTFRTGLDALLESIERDARLDDTTLAGVETTIRRRLRNRLRVEDWYATAGRSTDDAVSGPLSIMGLPRTGTTALGNVLSLDPQFRPLRLWEQLDPCPPPSLDTERDDPRRLTYIESTAALHERIPDLEAMHIYDADATTEDVHLIGLEFRSQEMTLPVLGYHRWWREGDMVDAYRYQRRVCALLQSARPPNRWLFKSPYHCYHLDAITEVYPDVCFVMTHRDPLKAIPSAVSFITTLYPPGARARARPARARATLRRTSSQRPRARDRSASRASVRIVCSTSTIATTSRIRWGNSIASTTLPVSSSTARRAVPWSSGTLHITAALTGLTPTGSTTSD